MTPISTRALRRNITTKALAEWLTIHSTNTVGQGAPIVCHYWQRTLHLPCTFPTTHLGLAVSGHYTPAGQAGGLKGAKCSLRGAVQLQLPGEVHSILEHHVGALTCMHRSPMTMEF
jgi:hypothetical protein